MRTAARPPEVKVKEQLMRPESQDDHTRVNVITSVLIRESYTSPIVDIPYSLPLIHYHLSCRIRSSGEFDGESGPLRTATSVQAVLPAALFFEYHGLLVKGCVIVGVATQFCSW